MVEIEAIPTDNEILRGIRKSISIRPLFMIGGV